MPYSVINDFSARLANYLKEDLVAMVTTSRRRALMAFLRSGAVTGLPFAEF